MLDHFGSKICRDQTCKWGIEWDTCAPGLLSCVASDFPSPPILRQHFHIFGEFVVSLTFTHIRTFCLSP